MALVYKSKKIIDIFFEALEYDFEKIARKIF